MEKTNLLTLVVTLTVGIILAGSLLAPVVADATTTERTFVNDGAFYVEVDPSETYTVEYDKAADLGVVYINGEPLSVNFSTGYTILAIDNAILRLQSGDTTIQYKGNGSYITGIKNLDITVANGTITGTYIGTSNVETAWPTTTYTECHIASPAKQDFVMTEYNSTVKMKGDSEIFAFGQTSVKNNTVLLLFKIEGNIKDGVTVTALGSSSGVVDSNAVVSDLTINATPVNGYIDLYDLSSITFNVGYEDTTTAVTYSAYIVPESVTAELANHFNSGEIAILNAIPMLIIIGLVLLGVGAIFVRNRD